MIIRKYMKYQHLLAAIFVALLPSITLAQGAAATPAPAIEVPAAAVTPDYVIGPGDVLQIFVWRNPELTTTVPVRPDGKISTPLVEDMVAVGKTPSELARDIEKVLEEFIRSPQVNIIVSNPVSVFSQIKVVGQVASRSRCAFREGMTVLDAILALAVWLHSPQAIAPRSCAGRRQAAGDQDQAQRTW